MFVYAKLNIEKNKGRNKHKTDIHQFKNTILLVWMWTWWGITEETEIQVNGSWTVEIPLRSRLPDTRQMDVSARVFCGTSEDWHVNPRWTWPKNSPSLVSRSPLQFKSALQPPNLRDVNVRSTLVGRVGVRGRREALSCHFTLLFPLLLADYSGLSSALLPQFTSGA